MMLSQKLKLPESRHFAQCQGEAEEKCHLTLQDSRSFGLKFYHTFQLNPPKKCRTWVGLSWSYAYDMHVNRYMIYCICKIYTYHITRIIYLNIHEKHNTEKKHRKRCCAWEYDVKKTTTPPPPPPKKKKKLVCWVDKKPSGGQALHQPPWKTAKKNLRNL